MAPSAVKYCTYIVLAFWLLFHADVASATKDNAGKDAINCFDGSCQQSDSYYANGKLEKYYSKFRIVPCWVCC